MNHDSNPGRAGSYQPHIDGLRALAVIMVIINHFDSGFLPSGFLGVDIFFVISGFVVTSSLAGKRYSSWQDYLLGFYVRRFKRLVPALSVSVLFTAALTCLLISRPTQILRSGGTALLGMSNLYFWKKATDYFATASELNPFTHTWSLGVEEQFYLVYPMLLGLCGYCVGRSSRPGRNLIVAVLALGIPSLLAYGWLERAHPSSAFFLMPARFWEFAAGCLAYLAVARLAARPRFPNATMQAASLLAVAALFALPFFPKNLHAVSVPVAVAVSCAAILVMAARTVAARFFGSRPLVTVGLLSYSLYLWHWPVLALSRYLWGVTPVSAPFMLAGIAALAYASYRFIEKPLRFGRWLPVKPLAFAGGLGAAFAAFLLVAVVLPRVSPEDNSLLATLTGIDGPPHETYEMEECHHRDPATAAARQAACLTASRTQAHPSAIYLLGDSHASKIAYLVSQAVAGTPYELRFMIDNTSADFPYTEVAPGSGPSNLDKVIADSRPGDVAVLTFHRGHLNAERDQHVDPRESIGPTAKSEAFRKRFEPGIAALAAKGVRVVLVRDMPLLATATTVQTCRMQERLFGMTSMCRIGIEADRRTRKRQDDLFDSLAAAYPGVRTWDPFPYLYRDGYFSPYDEQGRYLMIDWHHISRYQESLLVAPFRGFLADRILVSK